MSGLVVSWGGNAIDWQSTAAWAQAVLSALAIIASVWLVNRQHKLEIKRQRDQSRAGLLGRLASVEAEIRFCSEQCTIYAVQAVQEGLRAPGYRLASLAHDHSLPLLLSEGAFKVDEARDIYQFYVDAKSFNLGLDRLANWVKKHDNQMIDNVVRSEEVQRTLVKALHLVPADAPQRAAMPESVRGTASRFEAAIAALEAARHRVEASDSGA